MSNFFVKTSMFVALATVFCGTGCKSDENGDPPPPVPSSIRLSSTELSLDIDGVSQKIIATVLPEGVDQTVEWSSDDPDVATVEDGVITAVWEGNTKIWAKTPEYNLSAAVDLRVRPPMNKSLGGKYSGKITMYFDPPLEHNILGTREFLVLHGPDPDLAGIVARDAPVIITLTPVEKSKDELEFEFSWELLSAVSGAAGLPGADYLIENTGKIAATQVGLLQYEFTGNGVSVITVGDAPSEIVGTIRNGRMELEIISSMAGRPGSGRQIIFEGALIEE